MNELDTLQIQQILSYLPHRYPFLLIDRITDIEGEDRAVGIKNVSINEPFFQGHFPDHPIMPGVLIVEAMAQTAGAICAHNTRLETAPTVLFMTIDKVKFRKSVIPGDILHLHVEKIAQRKTMRKFSCIAKVDGMKVAEGEIGAMVGENI